MTSASNKGYGTIFWLALILLILLKHLLLLSEKSETGACAMKAVTRRMYAHNREEANRNILWPDRLKLLAVAAKQLLNSVLRP